MKTLAACHVRYRRCLSFRGRGAGDRRRARGPFLNRGSPRVPIGCQFRVSFCRAYMLSPCPRSCGEVPERSNGAVSKTVVLLAGDRGFESLPLRHSPQNVIPSLIFETFAPFCYERVLRKTVVVVANLCYECCYESGGGYGGKIGAGQ